MSAYTCKHGYIDAAMGFGGLYAARICTSRKHIDDTILARFGLYQTRQDRL